MLSYKDRRRIKELFTDGYSIDELSIMYNVTKLRIHVTLNRYLLKEKTHGND